MELVTSVGLDAAAALNTMTFIGELAKQERLIAVCTIHQPSTAIYLAFDGVLLLSEGRVAYRGAAAAAVDYFASRGRKMPEPASCGGDDFREILTGKTKSNRYRHAW